MLIQRPKPIVNQVADILRERIRRQTYLPGDRLPSESDLAQELGPRLATVGRDSLDGCDERNGELWA